MQNLLYTHIKYTIYKHILLITFLNESENIFQQLNDFKYCYIHIYPTPPLGQDTTQGQFLSGV